MATLRPGTVRRHKSHLSVILVVIVIVQRSHCINLGLLAGESKRHSSPIFIKKYSRHSPVFINIQPGILKTPNITPLPPLLPLKLPTKPPPFLDKLSKIATLEKLKSSLPLSSRLRTLPLPFIIPPIIPKVPLIPLPLLPPILPPVIPPLLLPVPILPKIPKVPIVPVLGSPVNPLRVPVLRKTLLQKGLDTELLPKTFFSDTVKNTNILDKLRELKRKGSLTTAEYIRFKNILL